MTAPQRPPAAPARPSLFGWHAALGGAALAWAASRCVETLPAANPRATAPAQLLRNWRLIGAHPTFAARTLLCASYGGLFTMLAASSFVFIDVLGVWAMAVPQWCFSVGHGVQQPYGQAGAFGTLVALISWTLVRRHGAPPPAAAAVAVATDAAI